MAGNENIGAIILAAGASIRLGCPKQLFEFESKPLVERITETALSVGVETVVVVGANAEKTRSSIKHLPAKTAFNENWEMGMSTSIATGLKKSLEINPNLDGVILLLCDQPFITKKSILRLIKAYQETDKPIVASKYRETVGVPALFSKDVFAELFELRGDKGAKTLIEEYAKRQICLVSMPEAAIDIDTKEDISHLNPATGA